MVNVVVLIYLSFFLGMKPESSLAGGPPAKQLRGQDSENKLKKELETLIKERNELKLKLSTAVYEVELVKSASLKLEEAYNACIAGLQTGMRVLTEMLTGSKSRFGGGKLDNINQKLTEVLQQTKELCVSLDAVQKPHQPECRCQRGEVESLTIAQKLLVEEFELKMFEKDQIILKLQADLKLQEEAHLRKVEELKTEIEGQHRVNPNYITCSICLDTWTSSGSHRVVCLACGHVFGDMCIRVHLNRCIECPLCRSPADSKDLRYLFLEGAHTE